MRLLKLTLVLVCGSCLMLAPGCNQPAEPPSAEKIKELETKMGEDMKNMTLPSNPATSGAPGGAAPGGAAPGAAAPPAAPPK